MWIRIRAAIVEDEPLAAPRFEKLINRKPGKDVVSIALTDRMVHLFEKEGL
jgi:hypothetical protein